MLDPAVLRPGRLDIKIKIDRPNAEGTKDIFSKHMNANLPIALPASQAGANDRDQYVHSGNVDNVNGGAGDGLGNVEMEEV